MELKVSSPKLRSSSDYISDPEEKEVSDDDDDDRNHKHRRREERSQSLERDYSEQVFMRPSRKRSKPFENGHFLRETDSQSSEPWKNYNTSLERDFNGKFEKKRPGLSTFSRSPLELNQRMRVNHSFSPRFSSVDISSQMVQQGTVPPSLFAKRGLPNVPNAQSGNWGAFGIVPGLANGGLETLHSLGMQGALRQPINPPLNLGIPRQRCRDFEERGFCLRGDMCPMEHGVNRIVVEDVQSLSQFNLPVSLPSTHLLGTTGGTGPLPSVTGPSSIFINSKGLHGKISKTGMDEDGPVFNGGLSTTMTAAAADFYDPDQPLWNNDCPQTSLLSLDEPESVLDSEPSDPHHVRSSDIIDSLAPGTSSSVWGRIGRSKNKSEKKEKLKSTRNPSKNYESGTRDDQEALASVQGTSHQGKEIITEESVPKSMDRRPSQKALRTLFVNGIPFKDNRRDSLFSHFRKFGEVIDIYIPANSERAFVQFSRREEAEAALKAPDAVMGNRFIKLWWANRDNIPDNGVSSSSRVTPRVSAPTTVASTGTAIKEKNSFQSEAPKASKPNSSDVSVPLSDQPKLLVSNGPKVGLPPPKKTELELLKEELRKKQEMLEQKRNDFKKQLDKLSKQATGHKSEGATDHQAVKRNKGEPVADSPKTTSSKTSDLNTVVDSPQAEVLVDKNKLAENMVPNGSKTNSSKETEEPIGLKQPIHPLAPADASYFPINRFKLDNRPTAFRIIPPLPVGFANVAVLKEHFSPYGDLSAVEVEDPVANEGSNHNLEKTENCGAQVSFTMRSCAEKAFINGKSWKGHALQFTWLSRSKSNNDDCISKSSSLERRKSEEGEKISTEGDC